MKRFSFFLILFFVAAESLAQTKQLNNQFVFSSPSGNYILQSVGSRDFSGNNTKVTIEKSIKGGNKFSKLADFSPVKTYDEFVKIAGSELATDFKNHIKAKSNDAVIQFINSSHPVKDYGLYILNINFLRVIGFAYLDEMPQDKTGQYEYRLIENGKTIKQQISQAFNKNDLPKGHVQRLFTTDSIVSITWNFPAINYKMPLLAKVYRQDDGKGKFFQYPNKIALNSADSRLTAFYEEPMTPEHLASYYIVPVDMFGNEGNPSDTATAITVDFKKIPGVQDVTIKDTLEGLLCQWKQLPLKPYYTGIQILRSRNAIKDFIVLDSVAANAVSYLDKQVLPNITYFYKFRPVVYKLSGWDEITATSFHGTKGSTHNPPLPPKNVEAFKEGRNVRLTWDHNQELDLFGYYVKRGTSASNMVIVSPAVMDTSWLDSTSNLSGRINYVYSVIAMNNNQLKSDESATAGIKPDRGGYVQAPSGITIRPEGKKLSLTWPDVSRNDVAIAGYVLYKKKTADKDFSPVVNKLIEKPYYEDENVEPNTNYVYCVTAVDRFGYESQKSPAAAYSLTMRILPPSDLYVRKLSGGVEISWPKNDNDDIVSFNIYRRTANENNFVKLGSAKPGSVFIDKKFIPGKLNIYAVSISTANSESDKSIEKTIFVEK